MRKISFGKKLFFDGGGEEPIVLRRVPAFFVEKTKNFV
jgi:hypothetical protein